MNIALICLVIAATIALLSFVFTLSSITTRNIEVARSIRMETLFKACIYEDHVAHLTAPDGKSRQPLVKKNPKIYPLKDDTDKNDKPT